MTGRNIRTFLVAAAMLSRPPESIRGTSFTAGMRAVQVNGFELHYTRNVSEAEAERVAAWLLREDVPDFVPGPMAFDHTDTRCLLDITTPVAPHDGTLARDLRSIALALSEAELKGARVEVRLRDRFGTIRTTLNPSDETPFIYN